MLKHYSHIQMNAKREALDAVWRKQGEEQRELKEQQESEAQNANQQRPPSESLPADRKDQKRRWGQRGRAPKIDPKFGCSRAGLLAATLRSTGY